MPPQRFLGTGQKPAARPASRKFAVSRVTNLQASLGAKNIGVARQTVRLIPMKFSLLKLGGTDALLWIASSPADPPNRQKSLLPRCFTSARSAGFHRNRTVLRVITQPAAANC